VSVQGNKAWKNGFIEHKRGHEMSQLDNSLFAQHGQEQIDHFKESRELLRNFMGAFVECDAKIQTLVLRLFKSMNDPDMDELDRQTAFDTILEALFPRDHANGNDGVDFQESEEQDRDNLDDDARIIAELDAEEELFRDRLIRIMAKKGINQTDLANKMGVGQPAISMLLNRKTRPQQRTISKVATALGVSPAELWPVDSAESALSD
jgi:lambda repressor-like predicted transcriptional regulator